MELPATPATAARPPERTVNQKRKGRKHRMRRVAQQAEAEKQAALLGVLVEEMPSELQPPQWPGVASMEQHGQSPQMQPSGVGVAATGGGGGGLPCDRPTNKQPMLHVGRAIDIFFLGSFKGDDDAYYRGVITDVDECNPFNVKVRFEDGDHLWFDLNEHGNEVWRWPVFDESQKAAGVAAELAAAALHERCVAREGWCERGARLEAEERAAEVAEAAIAAMRENMLLRLKPPVVQPSAGAGTVVAMPSRVLLAVRGTDRRNITELFMAWHKYIQKRVEETQVSRPGRPAAHSRSRPAPTEAGVVPARRYGPRRLSVLDQRLVSALAGDVDGLCLQLLLLPCCSYPALTNLLPLSLVLPFCSCLPCVPGVPCPSASFEGPTPTSSSAPSPSCTRRRR